MRSRILGVLFALAAVGLSASAQQSSTQDQLQALKENLTPEQQQALLQGVLGKGTGDGTTKTPDANLKTPESVMPKPDEIEYNRRRGKTRDGHYLRQSDEDPELRADDSVIIEMTRVEDLCARLLSSPDTNSDNSNGGLGNGAAMGVPANSAPTEVLNTLSGANPNGPSGLTVANANGPVLASNPSDLARCLRPEDFRKTDAEKITEEKFRKRILSHNPYAINRFGVLELPGLPAIPLAGLTASESTKRLNADPELSSWFVRVVLLRLLPSGQEALKPFGYDLFEGVPSTFAPVSGIQVPIDYIVGPGDIFRVQLYGNESSKYELPVERDGRINFPRLGPIFVSGMTFDVARQTIEERVAKQIIGTHVSVTMGDLRSIRVFVLGEAEKPGSYTVSGLSTMTNALFVSGGVKKIGSLRNIDLKRNGKLVTTLDLYDLLLHGDTSGDRQLMPGDVIFIPPIGNTASVDGAVRRPAIYELKHESTAEQVIALAGGLLPDADAKIGQLERILPSNLREMRNVDLTTPAGSTTKIDNGDKLKVPEIRPTLENSVTLSGYVYRPGQFQYQKGLRLSSVLGSFDELKPEADLHYIMIRRQVPPEERIEVISADLARTLAARGSSADPELRPRDQIFVFNLTPDRGHVLEPIIRDLELQATPDRPEQMVSIDGRVKAPGKYPLEPTMHVSDLIRAGGSLEDAAYRGQAELTRYAVVDGDARQTELISVDLTAIRRGDPNADLKLKPYDVLLIKPIPMWMEPGAIEVKGEVRFPGKYPIHEGETLHSVLLRAGGFTEAAFPEGAVFVRDELKTREREQLELLANRMQSDLAALSLEAISSSAVVNSAGGAAASQSLIVGRQLLAQLRNTKPVGRLVVDISAVQRGKAGGPEDVLLKDGDRLMIPKKAPEITILGEVQSPTSHVYQAGLTRDEYIGKSGGTTQKADRKRIYVVRANGDVVSGERSGWFRRRQNIEMRPGDTIVVPLDTERVNALPMWQAITTIIYNLAVALLAVRSV
jgi:polysaccharide export outer membrane protein